MRFRWFKKRAGLFKNLGLVGLSLFAGRNEALVLEVTKGLRTANDIARGDLPVTNESAQAFEEAARELSKTLKEYPPAE
tara:strand:- start:4288 stop:4524 length:237 start_codon:yes stop_codon:yes gene_type:complete